MPVKFVLDRGLTCPVKALQFGGELVGEILCRFRLVLASVQGSVGSLRGVDERRRAASLFDSVLGLPDCPVDLVKGHQRFPVLQITAPLRGFGSRGVAPGGVILVFGRFRFLVPLFRFRWNRLILGTRLTLAGLLKRLGPRLRHFLFLLPGLRINRRQIGTVPQEILKVIVRGENTLLDQ